MSGDLIRRVPLWYALLYRRIWTLWVTYRFGSRGRRGSGTGHLTAIIRGHKRAQGPKRIISTTHMQTRSHVRAIKQVVFSSLFSIHWGRVVRPDIPPTHLGIPLRGLSTRKLSYSTQLHQHLNAIDRHNDSLENENNQKYWGYKGELGGRK